MIEPGKGSRGRVLGRLEDINARDELTGRLRESGGAAWICRFRRQDIARVARAWTRQVEVAGRTDTSTSPRELSVETIQTVPEGALAAEDWNSGPSFDASPSIEELAREQDVGPIHDVEALFSFWPEDEDPGEFLRFIEKERKRDRGEEGRRDL